MYGLEVRRALSVVKVATGVLGMSSVDTAPQRLEATNVHRPGLRMRLLGRAWQFWILYERAVSVSQRKVTGGSARAGLRGRSENEEKSRPWHKMSLPRKHNKEIA